jgi:hypothetical protein
MVWYFMAPTNLVKYFPCGPGTAMGCVIKPLPNRLMDIGVGGNVEQVLMGIGLLDNGLSLAFDCQHHEAFAVLELLHKAAESI